MLQPTLNFAHKLKVEQNGTNKPGNLLSPRYIRESALLIETFQNQSTNKKLAHKAKEHGCENVIFRW